MLLMNDMQFVLISLSEPALLYLHMLCPHAIRYWQCWCLGSVEWCLPESPFISQVSRQAFPLHHLWGRHQWSAVAGELC